MKPALLAKRFSAGGVVFRRKGKGLEVVLIGLKSGRVWSLPKGILNNGEKPKDTALREVREETGIRARIVADLGTNSYWYLLRSDNLKCKKTVQYYLMRSMGGKLSEHDYEVDAAEWVSFDDAMKRLTYKGDRAVLARAAEVIPTLERKSAPKRTRKKTR
jgi:8-oxo-dGTP diphosphatase